MRDLLHVDDLLRLVDYQLAHFDELDGKVFNVGGGASNSLSLVETTQLCRTITGKTTPIEGFLEERPGDVPVFITDSSKVRGKTGWQPKIRAESALEDIHRWIFENEAALGSVLF